MKKKFFEAEYEVSSDQNIYALVSSIYGRESSEYAISSPFGASSLRQWDNGIYVFRKIEYDFEKRKFVMKDKVGIPDSEEFAELIARVKRLLSSSGCKRR